MSVSTVRAVTARKLDGPEYCMAVTVCSSRAASIISRSGRAACLVQPSVTASARLSSPPPGPAAISSASATNRAASARQACWPAALSSGTWSSWPGMPYMVAANGFTASQRWWKRSARSRAEVMGIRYAPAAGRSAADLHPSPVDDHGAVVLGRLEQGGAAAVLPPHRDGERLAGPDRAAEPAGHGPEPGRF